MAGAYLLRAYCLAVVVCNLDAVLLEARGAFEELAPHLLAELEQLWKLRLAGGEQAPVAAGSAAGAARVAAAALGESGLVGGRGWAAEPAGPEEEELGEQAGMASAVRRMGSRLQPGARPTAAPRRLGAQAGQAGVHAIQCGAGLRRQQLWAGLTDHRTFRAFTGAS